MKRLLLVEDEAHTRRMLAAALGSSESVAEVVEAASYQEAIARFDEGVDLLVSDLQLPDGSGLDVIRHARAASETMPILVITALGTEAVVLDAIAQGADGYLLKGGSKAELSRALESLLAGEAPISPAIARHVLKRFRSLTPPAPAEPKVSLSTRETEVLKLVGKGMKSAEIGELAGISTHTVNTHIRNIYRKLEVASRTEAVYEATRIGLLQTDY